MSLCRLDLFGASEFCRAKSPVCVLFPLGSAVFVSPLLDGGRPPEVARV